MNKNINILFLNYTYPCSNNGGTERSIDNLSSQFKKYGYTIFVGFYEGQSGKNENIKDSVNLSDKSSRSDLLKNFLDEKKIDIIIVFKITLDYSTIKVLKNCGIVIISSLRFDPLNYLKINYKNKNQSIIFKFRYKLGFYLFKYKINQLCKISYRYVILSKFIIDDLKKIINKKYLKKVIVINNMNTYSECIDYNNLLYKKENIILYVGRIVDKNKRLYLLLDIWKDLYNRIESQNWVLKIVGSGNDMQKIKDYAKQKSLKNIEFYERTDPIQFYKEAKFFLMTSVAEGFGMTLIESQTFGCVPIAFNTYKAIRDIIIDNYNGRLIKEGDIESYINSIVELINYPDEYFKLQRNSIDYVNKFSSSNIIPLWIDLFSKIK